MSILEHSWGQASANLMVLAPANLCDALFNACAYPLRHDHLGLVHRVAEHPVKETIALWFHDAIYDVHGQSNE